MYKDRRNSPQNSHSWHHFKNIFFKFQFGCFTLSVEAFKQFIPKGCTCILVQQYHLYFSVDCFLLHKTSVICPKYASMQSSVQYVARVLHFSASSLLKQCVITNSKY